MNEEKKSRFRPITTTTTSGPCADGWPGKRKNRHEMERKTDMRRSKRMRLDINLLWWVTEIMPVPLAQDGWVCQASMPSYWGGGGGGFVINRRTRTFCHQQFIFWMFSVYFQICGNDLMQFKRMEDIKMLWAPCNKGCLTSVSNLSWSSVASLPWSIRLAMYSTSTSANIVLSSAELMNLVTNSMARELTSVPLAAGPSWHKELSLRGEQLGGSVTESDGRDLGGGTELDKGTCTLSSSSEERVKTSASSGSFLFFALSNSSSTRSPRCWSLRSWP